MKRSVLILLLGVILGFAAYAGLYLAGTASSREVLQSRTPELAWLKQEFNLSDAELARISGLHAAYRPHCVEMCRRIDAKNAELRDLLAKSNALTPEIEIKLMEMAQLRAECQKAMLKHFMAVSQTMPPEQGKRYLAWVEEHTCLADHGMGMSPAKP